LDGYVDHFDILIKGGTVIDGRRMPRFQADVGIRDGVVAGIGRLGSDATRTIDAEGMIVAPGFVDLHTHYDAQLFWDPWCSLSGWHGVTSVVIGNCGFGFAPVAAADRERSMRSMTRVEAIPLASMQAGMPWNWQTFPEFLDAVDATPKSVNVLPYMPLGPLLTWVLGYERAKAGALPTDEEHALIGKLFEEALDAGACGWSAQRLMPGSGAANQRDWDGTPMVTDVMNDETTLVLAEIMGRRNEGFVQLTQVSGDPKSDAAHYERLARISGRPVLYNVVQAYDDRPNVHRNALKWLRQCRENGLQVFGQGVTTDAGFTFTFEDWNLFDDSDAWCDATTGTIEERLAKLADPARRQALKDQMPRQATVPLPQITVLGPRTAETKSFENLSIGEVAERTGKHPVDAMLDIAVADGLKTLFYASPPNVSIEHLAEIMSDPWILCGVSDGGAHTKFLTSGRYPTETITKVVRELGLLSLEEAHWRLSALPAMCAGFNGRGTIVHGAPADIVVYDYDALDIGPSEVAHDLPGGEWRRIQRAIGYKAILVNGEVTIEDGQEQGANSGRLLRHGG
jgi:N-acyl-D-amino-acid deacylase